MRHLDPHCIIRDLLLWCTDSLDVAVASEVVVCGLSCSAACEISVPSSGIKAVFPKLQGRFLTTGPPGKPQTGVLY